MFTPVVFSTDGLESATVSFPSVTTVPTFRGVRTSSSPSGSAPERSSPSSAHLTGASAVTRGTWICLAAVVMTVAPERMTTDWCERWSRTKLAHSSGVMAVPRAPSFSKIPMSGIPFCFGDVLDHRATPGGVRLRARRNGAGVPLLAGSAGTADARS
jgi:hypothetical protein